MYRKLVVLQMRIEDIDFAPCYYGPIACESPLEMHADAATISMDECEFLGVKIPSIKPYSKETLDYFRQLYTYYHRFNSHMPPPIRRVFLLELIQE